MRAFAFVVAMATFTASASAQGTWMEYFYPDLGFIVQFPGQPTASTGTYNTTLMSEAPVHNYVLQQENAVFIATAVDMLDHGEDGARLLIEAEYSLQFLGDLVANPVSRVETGIDSVFGRFLTVDCRSDRIPDTAGQVERAREWYKDLAGFDCPDGGRLTVNLFFLRGRLYMFQGMNLPSEQGRFGPMGLRFANSVSFYRPDGTRNPADNVQ